MSAGPSKGETVDERMFVSCVQTHEGRAAGRPPNCSSWSIRFMGEAASTAEAGASKGLALSAVPLPVEGNRDSLTPSRQQVVIGPETKYWKPGGVYLWSTNATNDILKHMMEDMSISPERHHVYEGARERLRRAAAAWERRKKLSEMGKMAPPTGMKPRAPYPIHESSTLIEITPSHLGSRLTTALSSLYAPALRLVNISVSESTHSRLANDLAESVKRNDSAQLWGLLGRVTSDYQRLREQQRKAIEDTTAKEPTPPRKEKAP